MTGVVLVVLVSVLCAAAVLSLLAAGHRPPEGWQEWTRQSVGAWRADDLRPDRWSDADADAGVDLFSLGESEAGTGYAHPRELRVRRARTATPH